MQSVYFFAHLNLLLVVAAHFWKDVYGALMYHLLVAAFIGVLSKLLPSVFFPAAKDFSGCQRIAQQTIVTAIIVNVLVWGGWWFFASSLPGPTSPAERLALAITLEWPNAVFLFVTVEANDVHRWLFVFVVFFAYVVLDHLN